MPHTAKLAALQKRLGHTFRQPALLAEALRHASSLQDQPAAGAHNQRLEFLGDSVLHFVLTDALFRQFPEEREGVLSRRRAGLSKGEFLSRLARDLGVDAGLQLGQSEEDAGGRGRDSILEDALEAIVGAIYLDADFATAQRVVLGWYGSLPERLKAMEGHDNPKGQLQEMVQPAHGNGALRYEVVKATGPKHAQEYEVAVLLNGRTIGSGRGTSKKNAEEEAARIGLDTLRHERAERKE
ncbi:ribonuclease III [Oleiharenicola sp. Vm1]|uniref:ribonuclease III n=1 Tax=Oleiharenicola sp. Vm1 TaxID=3398393 RepID=UPI0039F60E1A